MSKKKERLSREVKYSISDILMREIKDPRIGFVTVMDVEVSDDYKYAKVFISVMGEESDVTKSFRCLESARGFVQKELGKRLKAKYTPIINWMRDKTVDKTMRITELLNEDQKNEAEGE